jgi:hypothetical protein
VNEGIVTRKIVVHPIRAMNWASPRYWAAAYRSTSIGGQQLAVRDREGQRASISDAPVAACLPSAILCIVCAPEFGGLSRI